MFDMDLLSFILLLFQNLIKLDEAIGSKVLIHVLSHTL